MDVEIKSIMCPTDFSDFSNYAAYQGVFIAKNLGAKLYVCHVVDLSSVSMYPEGLFSSSDRWSKLEKYAYEYFERMMNGQTIEWEPLISMGYAADEIARLAEEKNVDLVVLATQARSGVKRLMIGSVTESLMKTLSCPLFIISTPQGDKNGKLQQMIKENTVNRILVGCDFSSSSLLTFQYGLSLAKQYQSELELVHVVEPQAYRELIAAKVKSKEALRQHIRDQLNIKFDDLINKETLGDVTPKTTLLAGQPHEEIIKFAALNDIDVIVLGVRGLTLTESLFVGSTTDRVVRQATCPVLVVRPTNGSVSPDDV